MCLYKFKEIFIRSHTTLSNLLFTYLVQSAEFLGQSAEFQNIFIVQKRVLRILVVTNKTTKIGGKYQHTNPLFQKTNILTLHNLYYYSTSTECRKLIVNNNNNNNI